MLEASAAEASASAEADLSAAQSAEDGAVAADAAPEMESYYTFTWAPRPRGPRRGSEGEARGPRRSARPPAAGEAPQAEGAEATGNRGGRRHGGKPRERREGDAEPRPRSDGRPGNLGGKGGDRGDRGERPDRGGKPGGKPRGPKPDGARSFEARPPRDKPMDPDSPFAILAALKNKS